MEAFVVKLFTIKVFLLRSYKLQKQRTLHQNLNRSGESMMNTTGRPILPDVFAENFFRQADSGSIWGASGSFSRKLFKWNFLYSLPRLPRNKNFLQRRYIEEANRDKNWLIDQPIFWKNFLQNFSLLFLLFPLFLSLPPRFFCVADFPFLPLYPKAAFSTF